MRVFEAFYLLNRSFEATIHTVDQLQRLEFFQNAELPVLHNRLEELRSETNEVLIENMLDYEQGEAFRFGELVKQWERSTSDDSELFFRSEEHKEKMRARIKELQEALARQGPDRRISRQKSRKRKPAKRKAVEQKE
jgi:molecular chaperone DnaK (HSP70)